MLIFCSCFVIGALFLLFGDVSVILFSTYLTLSVCWWLFFLLPFSEWCAICTLNHVSFYASSLRSNKRGTINETRMHYSHKTSEEHTEAYSKCFATRKLIHRMPAIPKIGNDNPTLLIQCWIVLIIIDVILLNTVSCVSFILYLRLDTVSTFLMCKLAFIMSMQCQRMFFPFNNGISDPIVRIVKISLARFKIEQVFRVQSYLGWSNGI